MKAFQQAMTHEVHGFVMDGIMGSQTWQALVTEALSGSSGTNRQSDAGPYITPELPRLGDQCPGTA